MDGRAAGLVRRLGSWAGGWVRGTPTSVHDHDVSSTAMVTTAVSAVLISTWKT